MSNEEQETEEEQPMLFVIPDGDGVKLGMNHQFPLEELELMCELAVRQVQLTRLRMAMRQMREQQARKAANLLLP